MSNPIDDLSKRLDTWPTYLLEVGVISTGRRKTKTETVRLGITNAELLYIHEHGSTVNHIPARPVLDYTIKWANQNLLPKTIDKCVKIFLETGDKSLVKREMDAMAIDIQNYARDLIYKNDGTFVANAPATIEQKGFNHPLFRTGQLARSITCHVIEIK